MNAAEAFAAFVERVLVPAKARRFAVLARSAKGQRKIVQALCHEFEPALRPDAIQSRNYDRLFGRSCFAFHSPLGFGVEFADARDAYEQLSIDDSWLIVLQDASAGIHRPEARWADEKLIAR